MKRGWIVLLAVLFVALSVIVWEFGGAILFLIMLATEPAGWGCDEGPVVDRSSVNPRGDLVAEYERACTGIGTFLDHWIVLQLHDDKETTILVEYSDLRYDFPKFRWIGDDTLIVDLGKVYWVSPKTNKVGSIRISYAYSKAGTSWW